MPILSRVQRGLKSTFLPNKDARPNRAGMSYVEDEIPLPLLLKQRSGDFAKLDKTLEDVILDYIPKSQSAFDYVLPALRHAYKNNQSILEVPGVMESITGSMLGVMSRRVSSDIGHIV